MTTHPSMQTTTALPTATGVLHLAESVGDLLTSVEVAEIIRVPHATLRYWRHIGIGPKSFKMGPRRVLYRVEDVLAWVSEQYGAGG